MSKVILLGEAWGSNEAAAKSPFVGATGRELNRLLEETGFLPRGTSRQISPNHYTFHVPLRDRIYADHGLFPTNVFNLQPRGNKIEDLCGPRWGDLPAIRPGKYIRPEFLRELERLENEILYEKPNLIIGLGGTACWFCLGRTAVTKFRGTVALTKYGKFLPTFHPAFLFKGAWDQRVVVKFDLEKALREAAYPELRRPERNIYIPDSVEDLLWGRHRALEAARLSVDIETVGDQITCIGFAWSAHEAFVIPIFDFQKPDRCYWDAANEMLAWNIIRELCECSIPKVFQNGMYDVHFLWKRYNIKPANCAEDTMLLHHALQPEVKKGLGFLGSIYTNEASWKVMRGKSKTIKDVREE